jgi:hypothetical protein
MNFEYPFDFARIISGLRSMIDDPGSGGCSASTRVGAARLRAFHDAVLELGSAPLPVVTARMELMGLAT